MSCVITGNISYQVTKGVRKSPGFDTLFLLQIGHGILCFSFDIRCAALLLSLWPRLLQLRHRSLFGRGCYSCGAIGGPRLRSTLFGVTLRRQPWVLDALRKADCKTQTVRVHIDSILSVQRPSLPSYPSNKHSFHPDPGEQLRVVLHRSCRGFPDTL